MKNFAHKKDGYKVYYLDVNDMSIKIEKIKTLGTELGYYSDEIEEYLSNNAEQIIGKISRDLKDFANQKKNEMTITQKDELNIKKFLTYSIIRSKRVIDIANSTSKLADFIGGYET
ncbi:MAG: DUF4238 domain-containing protein, partial [Acidaminobacteraceae bacterium]